MPKTKSPLVYRVKGLPDRSGDALTQADAPSATTPLGKQNPAQMMAQVFRCWRRPHLSDFLYHFAELRRLSRRWPTFAYLQPRRMCGWIKSAPLHLAPYLSWGPPYDSEGLKEKMLVVQDRQETTQQGIEDLLRCLDLGEEPKVRECPLTMGMACHLFAGSSWLRANQDEILRIAMLSSAGAYVALASGTFADEFTALTERIACDAKLLLDLTQSPVHKQRLRHDWVVEKLQRKPVYHALWLFINGKEKAAFDLLLKAAETNPIAAGICLGLHPSPDEQDRRWIQLIHGRGEPLYWAARVWQAGHEKGPDFPHNFHALMNLKQDHRWLFHWLRDVSEDDVRGHVQLMWPSPWSVEIIVDHQMPKDFVVELATKRNLDITHPIESAVILWASDYTTV
jgi:hypothetical protein